MIYSLPGIMLMEVLLVVKEKPTRIRTSTSPKECSSEPSSFPAHVHEEMQFIDQGTLILRNRRLAFAGTNHATVTDYQAHLR